MADATGDTFEVVTDEAKSIVKKAGDFVPSDGVPIPRLADLETPEAATDWATNEILKATPRAVQEVIHQMRKGEPKARLMAALQILDRAGVKEKQNNITVAPVIVLTKDTAQNLPWVKQTGNLASIKPKDSQIVDGEIVKSKTKVIPGGSQ